MNKRLAVKLSPAGEKAVLSGHPWVFSNRITKINKEGETGDLAIIYSKSRNTVIGIGLYDKDSPIRIKLIHKDTKRKTEINAGFFHKKIKEAFAKRAAHLPLHTNAYRLIFGENDDFPGLIADVYDQVLVLKLYSGIWRPYLNGIIDSALSISGLKTAVVRLSRGLQKNNNYNLKDGQVIRGELAQEEVVFTEHGAMFMANVLKGHKTGFFLDHRANRHLLGSYSTDKTVLDVFSYAGGFSVHALVKGAKTVTSVDISKQALNVARRNVELNAPRGQHHVMAGDAFEILKSYAKSNVTFDVVVIDPPSFAKQKTEITLAKKKYAQLAALGASVTSKNGLLVLASCSSRVGADAFFDLNRQVLDTSGRPYQMIHQTFHDFDHPVTYREGAYLKCGFYKFQKTS